MNHKKTNRLAGEKSPYLLQHAENPVDWFPWGEEAFERARREDKPIFLSIGYSTCHWCHVMERESFEDNEVAASMNDAFISIKVDREERPDIDGVYMTVSQLLTRSGGWPLSIIMTPEKKPFFAATYMPKHATVTSPGMIDLCARIKDLWQSDREGLEGSAEKITSALRNQNSEEASELQETLGGEFPSVDLPQKAFGELSRYFDQYFGGFGPAPKFPSPHNLVFLTRYGRSSGEAKALAMVEKTLTRMRLGGIFDQIGFGFHRYSTDAHWLVPHFEKMLYDQALIVTAYIEGWRATGNALYERAARETISYVLRDMTSEEGGFFSAEDADSEGVEGKFYLWSEVEIREVLGEDADFSVKVFGALKDGNYGDEVTGAVTGLNILNHKKDLLQLAEELGLNPAEFDERLERVRLSLFEHRAKRVPPFKDDKVLTDWNGLMIAALASAAAAFDDDGYREAAEKAARFILAKMRAGDGLFHRYRGGEASIQSTLNDYVYLVWGLIELYGATLDAAYLKAAFELNALTIEKFWDEEGGGFFFTPSDGEVLLHSQKEVYDGAQPSSNSVALMNLFRLSGLTGDSSLSVRGEALIKAFLPRVERIPSAHTHFLSAMGLASSGASRVVIVGEAKGDDTRALISAARSEYMPGMSILFKDSGKESSVLGDLIEDFGMYETIDGAAAAYLCIGGGCREPVTDPSALIAMLKEIKP